MRADARQQRDEHPSLQPLCIAEAAVSSRLGDADRLGDIINSDRREAAPHEKALRLSQDSVTCLDNALRGIQRWSARATAGRIVARRGRSCRVDISSR
jgi:hypothetical protein